MKNFILEIIFTFFIQSKLVLSVCPLVDEKSSASMPQDDIHGKLNQVNTTSRKLRSLTIEDPILKRKLNTIITNRVDDFSKRNLQECISEEEYYALDADIEEISGSIFNNLQRSHFFGGIVRLAAHDFMDFNQMNDIQLGSDGCIDFDDNENAGLDSIWCDSCALKQLYDISYSTFMSKADFWIASANAVIRQTSVNNQLDLVSSFQWGRVDKGGCRQSSGRIPKGNSCTEVENALIRRMGLSWRDAAALMGAHTLGRGDSDFSGHHGIWVDEVEESLIFDKRYYTEMLDRNWELRNAGKSNQDWTWGRRNGDSPRFMLNTDMCLRFDIDSLFPCCSSFGDDDDNCQRCLNYPENSARRDAADAVDEFAEGRFRGGENSAFYAAFEVAWQKATMNGWLDALRPLSQTCSQPTQVPTPLPSTIPTEYPTYRPSTTAPTYECVDTPDFFHKGNSTTCDWVESKGKCKQYARLCPMTCDQCGCLDKSYTCEENSECCTGRCENGVCKCYGSKKACTRNVQCCSGYCNKNEGLCRNNVPLAPTSAPTLSPGTSGCRDVDFLKKKKNCEKVIKKNTNKCKKYAHLCRKTCGECDCLKTGRICSSSGDCCSGICADGKCKCIGRKKACSKNAECCGDLKCKDGHCREKTFAGSM